MARRAWLAILLLGTAGLSAGAEAPPAAAPELTLRAACREAAGANNQVLAARMTAAAELERREQAAARYWPRLDLSERYLRSDNPSLRGNLLADQNKLPEIARESTVDYRTQAELTWTIFDGGARAGAWRAADSEFSASLRASEETRARALTVTAETFLIAVFAEEELRVTREEADRMAKRLELAAERKQQGRALDEDLALAAYHLERARKQALAAGHAAENAREALGRMLGRQGKVTERLVEGAGSPLELSAGSVAPGSAEAAALKDSPELHRRRQEQAARLAALDAQRAAWWPRLDASATYRLNDEKAGRLDSNEDSYFLGLELSWPLFDGGLRRARIAEARRRADAAEFHSRETELVVSDRARRSARAELVAERDAEVARLKVVADDAVFKRVEKSHEAGRATFQELLKAQSDLADAQLALVRARQDQRRAAALFLEATGFWAGWE